VVEVEELSPGGLGAPGFVDGAHYTQAQVCERLQISRPTFYAWCRRHGVRRVLFGRAVRYAGASINRALQKSERTFR
jgi:excisionase family DNA binding protein